MEVMSMVKTSLEGTTDATKLLRITIYEVCSEAIESYDVRDLRVMTPV